MVQRTFPAFDNEAFTIDPSSPNGTPGAAIINNSSTPVGRIFTFNAGFPYQTITLDDTSSTPDLFNDDQEDDHTIIDGKGLVPNGTPVESESFHFFREIDDDGDPFGPTITVTVFSQNGQTSNIWGMAADAELTSGARYVKTGGNNNGTSEYDEFVPCFTAGTLIATRGGLRPIESLRPGDRVITRENGAQDVVWTGQRRLLGAWIAKRPHLAPIRIRKGALGDGRPRHDMLVSPNHRMLVAGPEIPLLFGETEALTAAKHLVGRPGIDRAPLQPVTYVHVMCAGHEVLRAAGAWSESFHPGDYALDALETHTRAELLELFPDLATPPARARFPAARPVLTGSEARVLHTVSALG